MTQKPQTHRFSTVILVFSLLLFWSCGKEQEESSAEKPASTAETPATGDATAYRAAAVQNGATIFGKVTFKGKWSPSTISVTKDQEVCGKSKKIPALLVSEDEEVQDAVVYITDIKQGKKIEQQKVTLDQKACEYHPHVLAFPAGSTVEIKNPDGILHNIHSYSEKNDPFNMAQPKFKKTLTVTIEKPEIIPVKCDVHAWMSGWFFVAESPYFSVTDNEGSFKLADVPPGEYMLEAWHEKLGKQSRKIKVGSNETTELKFEFSSVVN